MNAYAQKMRDMLARVGEPVVSTTTVQPPKQKLDIGSLMMMLMMSNMFKKPGVNVSDPSNIMNPAEILGPMGSEGGFGGSMEMVSGGSPFGSSGGAGIGQAGDAGGFSGLTPEMLFKVLLGMRGR